MENTFSSFFSTLYNDIFIRGTVGLLLEGQFRLFTVLVLLIFSLIIRQAIILLGQNWVKTFSHTLTLILLPIITYVITSVISSNLALALGMVGALSIVRFRNPVKSPFELAIYFTMITAGIAGAVSLKWLLLLLVSIFSVLILSFIINKFYLIFFGRSFYTVSFTEGNSLHTLEITSKATLVELASRYDLVNFVKNDNNIIYRIANSNKKEIMDVAASLENNDQGLSIVFNSA